MKEQQTPVHSMVVERAARKKLQERGVHIEDIAKIVYNLQIKYNPEITMEDCLENADAILRKREVQHAILVGIELDELTEKGLLSEPLLSLIKSDEGLFGVDETLALGSVLGFGSIAVTTFGFLDKEKLGIISALDSNDKKTHTFLDDLVASISASASARLAHRLRDRAEEAQREELERKGQEGLIG